MKKLFLLLVTVMTVAFGVSAQMRTVTGTVVEEANDEPIIGASVTPAGSSKGVVTDIDGNFSIQVPAGVNAITVSYVGFNSQTVAITGSHLNIALKNSAEMLNDVIVVAYGTAKKSEYTGSAGVVKADQLEDALVSNVTNALSGKVAGVQTLSSNGQPGTSATVLVRGVGSINSSTTPLYVVDGMPYDGGISEIAPGDIESMTVLKDAASTALYGARGANGVILITTKRGQQGNAKVNLDMRWGSNSRMLPNYDVITNSAQYIETLYQSLYMSNFMPNYQAGADNSAAALAAHKYANNNIWTVLGQQTYTVPNGQTLIGTNGKINPNATLGYTDGNYYYTPDDWIAGTFRNGLRQEYNISISGGGNGFTYYVGGGYLNDEGIIDGSHYNRFSSRSNVEYQAKPWLKIGTNTSYVYANSGYPSAQTSSYSSSTSNAFAVAYQMAPVFPMYVRDAQGNIMHDSATGHPIYDYGLTADYGYGYIAQRSSGAWSTANPKGSLVYDKTEYLMDVLDTKWYAIINPLAGLTINGTVGYFVDNTRTHNLDNPLYGQSASTGGMNTQSLSRDRTLNLQGLVTYQRTFADVHNAEIMVGVESQDEQIEGISASGKNLYNPSNWTVSNTIDQRYGSGYQASLAHRSGLARLKYNYDNKYFFMGSFRRDGSSAFAPKHRWGSFWSASVAWDIKKESFLREVSAVDLLKFKASFGQNGNDRIYDSSLLIAYQDFYTVGGSDGVFSDSELAYKGNSDITWEKSNSFNIGFDFSFWHGKLDGSLEYYSRQTSDMLMNLPVAPSLGYTSIPSNVGAMRNYGVELDLNWHAIQSKNVNLDVFANATLGRNKIISLSETLLNNDGSWEYSTTRLMTPGKSMYNLWIVDYAGVNDEGLALYTALRNKQYSEIPDGANADNFVAQTDASGNQYYIRWTGAYKTNYKGQYVNSDGQPLTDEEADKLDTYGVKVYDTEEYNTTDWKTARDTNRKVHNILPKVYGGFGFNLDFYGFDLSASLAYQLGGHIYDSGYASFMDPGTTSYLGKTWHKDMLNAWTPDNTNTDVPRMANDGDAADYANATSTRFVTSSNYLSLNNVTFGYTLPASIVRSLRLGSVRLYASAENVALWSARKGLDPRQGFISSSNATYSPIRSISGGVKVSF
jgi:TonB-linked SusC/RagA family outer membrane protein